ncbi:aspartate/glutamate racemase family protein [Yimella sp. cx-51]|uniref:aspartate/glutamate racemase family protein n=1 Tax=Yimella sp. cx-51 TaxID=2770551 RepID=UPI00165E34A3|nr:amino acid racemase [Yimella sp. cx-51]MBC9955648.1 amino acid racemase [Yimella sp. cx-51]MBD2759361.1 amino acid racemase [Yimella sp. cx-573]QTH37781.1 amino acid racemase [Yimella sp. cx-51]
MSTSSKTIGLIGGLSWESTAEYYRLANEAVHSKHGGLHSARLLLSSLDFAQVQQLQDNRDWDALGALLGGEAKRLEDAGAQIILLCSNPLHAVAGRIEDAISIRMLHIADVAAEAAAQRKITEVGLLGTAFTMNESFYRERLEGRGLTVHTPAARDITEINRIIYDELCVGIVTEKSRRFFRQVMQDLDDRGADGIILGATEIELLVDEMDADVPLFPTTRLHIQAALDHLDG